MTARLVMPEMHICFWVGVPDSDGVVRPRLRRRQEMGVLVACETCQRRTWLTVAAAVTQYVIRTPRGAP
jgi:hypothetical protein